MSNCKNRKGCKCGLDKEECLAAIGFFETECRFFARKTTFSVAAMLIDAYAPITTPGEIAYWQNKQPQEA